jgi:DNA-binding NtrC family response regulator
MTATNSVRVLVVDDEPDAAEALTLLLKPRGFDVRVAGTGDGARAEVMAWRPHLVLLDLMLPDVNGLDLLRDFRVAAPDTQIVMVTGYGSVPKVVEAMNGGAFGFIEKPIDAMLLLAVLGKATEKLALAAENRRLRSELHDHATLDDMVARSDKMKQLFTLVRKVAPSDASVLILGENGTGKELVASALHQNSKRAKGPFIKINCAAIPSELIESELFGHKRGSFTGALADRPGVIELADGGSLLLDEIGEMPASLQAKLLRVLQEREFTPVGSTRPIKSDFRLICSTNLNLDAALADKKLRQDLYFRINTFTLALPALRERTTDIPLLAEYFLERYAARHQREVTGIHPDAMRVLQRHRWPGNVRELEHVLERAVIVATEAQIQVADLPATLRDAEPDMAHDDAFPAHHTLEEIERMAILRTLERTQWNKRAAATILGVYRPTLYSKLKKYNLLKRPAPVGAPTN